MAKQKGMITIRGKLGDLVYTEGKQGNFVRSTPTLSEAQRKAKADLPQNRRTGLLNRLASTLNKTVKHYAGTQKSKRFYSDLHSTFRGVRSDERTLLLNHIHQRDVNPRYAFGMACPQPKVKVTVGKNAYNVHAVISPPAEDYRGYNSLRLEFILLVFTKGNDACRHEARYTPFISVGHRKPNLTTTFDFPRTAKDTDYLLACRAVFATNEKEDGFWTARVMCFLTGAPVTAKGLKLLQNYKPVLAVARPVVNEAVEKRVMVELKEITDDR